MFSFCVRGLKDRIISLLGAVVAFALLFLFYVPSAEAIPAFAKKYSSPCSFCHSSWPLLNEVGWKFKQNGYQMLETRDGAEAGKTSPSFDLHLDSNKAVNPFSLRLDGGVDALQPKSGPATAGNPTGALPNNFPCCTEGNRGRVYAAGTIDQDMAYFLSYKLGDTQLEQGFVRFVNIFGPGYMGVDLGAIQTGDSEAVSPNREWFGSPNPAYFGVDGAKDLGGSLGFYDAGARFFGKPNDGPFSYDVTLATGLGSTTLPSASKGSAIGILGRIDAGGFSGSLRFWSNNTSSRYFSRQAGGPFFFFSAAPCAASSVACLPPPAASGNQDELTMDYVLSLRYDSPTWETDLVFLWNDYNTQLRSDASGNTYRMDNLRRTGMSAVLIYRFSSRLALGARLGVSSVPGYNQTYDGAVTAVPSATASQMEIKLDITPVQNAKLSLGWTMDTSDRQARVDAFGNTYDQQNKLFLLWDWAI